MEKNYLSVVYDEKSHPIKDCPELHYFCTAISPFFQVRTKNKFFVGQEG